MKTYVDALHQLGKVYPEVHWPKVVADNNALLALCEAVHPTDEKSVDLFLRALLRALAMAADGAMKEAN